MLKWLSEIFTLLLFLTAATVYATPLPLLEDMPHDRQIAENRFILVFISQSGCSYCIAVEEDILKPMQLSGQYEQRLLFRNLIINSGKQLITLQGKTVSANDFARSYQSYLTPTLLFLHPRTGEQLSEKMVGVSTPELYGFYVDKAIDQAFLKLNPGSAE